MSGKQVIFYEISDGFLEVITKLSEKLYQSGEKTLLLLSNESKLKEVDLKLWTYSKLSFVPHGSRFSISLDNANMCSIWLSTEVEFLNQPTVLMRACDNEEIDNIVHFNKIIDIFNSGETLLKSRSEKYTEMGFLNQKLWIQDEKSWKNGTIK